MPGDGGVLPPEHPYEELGIAGKGVLHAAAQDTEPEPDILDGIVICGEGYLVCQPVCHGLFQHGHIAAVGIEGVQVLAEVGLSLGAEGVCVDAGAQVVQLHLGTVPDVDAGNADGGVQQQERHKHYSSYNKEAGVDGDVAFLAAEQL